MRGRLLVQGLKEYLGLSERRAGKLLGLGRSTYRYKPVLSEENEQLQERIVELALTWRRFGYRRLHALLIREGWQVNHKRVYRLYTQAGLAVCRRKKNECSLIVGNLMLYWQFPTKDGQWIS